MKTQTVQVIVVGEIPCCICGEMMSQKEVDAEQAILSTSPRQMPYINIIAHIHHFYTPDNQPTDDIELSMKKLALAVAQDRGEVSPQMIMAAKAEIAKLEKRFT